MELRREAGESGGQRISTRFELSQTPEGREIRAKIEAEYKRRMAILGQALEALNIPKDQLMLVPAVLERTDLGYIFDIDLVYFGKAEDSGKLYDYLHDQKNIFTFIIEIDQARMEELKRDFPDFYQFLEEGRGNVPEMPEEFAVGDSSFNEEAGELEDASRRVLSLDQKQELRRQRMAIRQEFIQEIEQRIRVAAFAFSRSMTRKGLSRFDISSDLDIDIVIDSQEYELDRNTYAWIAQYLRWKYARAHQIKVDTHVETLGYAASVVRRDGRFRDFYKKVFGLDISPAPHVSEDELG